MLDPRSSAASRGYNNRWRKAAATFLARHPFCHWCEIAGRRRPATVVHHSIPHRGDRNLFWNVDTWVALCKSCHDRHGQRQDHGKIMGGCDASGWPLDSNHPWATSP